MRQALAVAVLGLACLAPAQNLFKTSGWTATSPKVTNLKVLPSEITFEPRCTGTSCTELVGIKQTVNLADGYYQFHFAGWTTGDGALEYEIRTNGQPVLQRFTNEGYFHFSRLLYFSGPITFEFVSKTTDKAGRGWKLLPPVMVKANRPAVLINMLNGGTKGKQWLEVRTHGTAAVALGIPSPWGGISIPGIKDHLLLSPNRLVFLQLQTKDWIWAVKPNMAGTEAFFLPANYVPLHLQALSFRDGFGELGWL